MSALFVATLRTLDTVFAAPDPAELHYDITERDESSTLAQPERTSITLRNGEVIDVDLYQISAGCWSAKNADHDGQCGWDATRELALKDLESLCNDDIEPCSCGSAHCSECGEDPREVGYP